MRLRNAALAACGILALAWGAPAQETVKLEYKLKPGTELIYRISGTVKVNSPGRSEEGTLSALPRFVVADVDAATGAMLVGQLPATRMTKSNGSAENAFDDVSACRMDRAGNPPARKMKDEEKLGAHWGMMLRMFSQRQLDLVSLPAGAVAAGATWEGATDSALPEIPLPMPCKVLSTLAEIKTVDGHKCAVIQSKLTPADRKAVAGRPGFAVTGEAETLFDVEGGFSRRTTRKLELKGAEGGGPNVTVAVEVASDLDSMKMLPPEEVARESKVIRALDAAAAALYDGEYAKAADALENLKPADVPEAWKKGVNKAIGDVKHLGQRAGGAPVATEAAPVTDPAQKLFAEAEKDKRDQKWADAVAKYKEVVEKYPAYPMAPVALVRAAEICETKLNDKPSADAFRRQALAQQEKRAAGGSPIELYKLAATYAESGDAEKAIATYRRFLAGESPEIPASTRLLAQWRIGGLLEKQGKTAEAVEAYKALSEMKGDDNYSTKLKDQAKKKIEALTAVMPREGRRTAPE